MLEERYLEHGYTLFSHPLTQHAVKVLSPCELRVWLILMDQILGYKQGRSRCISNGDIAHRTDLSSAEAREGLARLKARHAIWIKHRPGRAHEIGLVLYPEDWDSTYAGIPAGTVPGNYSTKGAGKPAGSTEEEVPIRTAEHLRP